MVFIHRAFPEGEHNQSFAAAAEAAAADTYAAEPAAAEAEAAADDTAADCWAAALGTDRPARVEERFGSAAEQRAAEYRAVADRNGAAAAEAVGKPADRTEAAAVAAAEHTAAEAAADRAAADTAAEAADYNSEPDSCRSLPIQKPCPSPFFRILLLFFRVLQKRVRDPSLFLSRNPSYCLTLSSPLKFIIHLTYFLLLQDK